MSRDYTHVLLLQSYCAKGLWGFPKGKLDGSESSQECAIREVYEETGYDTSKSLDPDWYIEGEWSNASGSGKTGMYIIPNVSMKTNFAPMTKNEIEEYRWFKLKDLLEARKGFGGYNLNVTAHAYLIKNLLERFLVNKTRGK